MRPRPARLAQVIACTAMPRPISGPETAFPATLEGQGTRAAQRRPDATHRLDRRPFYRTALPQASGRGERMVRDFPAPVPSGMSPEPSGVCPMSDAYRDDLAFIHDAGFGHFARHAAAVLVERLHADGVAGGRVIDLGCGSGILSQAVADAGFGILGIDLSPAMVALARERVPAGEFRVGSCLTEELPPCVAVAAVGEVLNYLFDRGNKPVALARLFRRIHAALVPGGLL